MTMNLTKCLWCSITSSQLLLILGITKCQDTICIPPNLEPTVHQGICQLSLIFLQVRGVTPNIYNQYHSCFQNCPWLGMRWWGQRQPMRTDLSVGRRDTHREPCLTRVIPPCPVSTCEVKTMLWVIHSKNFVISCFHPNHLPWVPPQCLSAYHLVPAAPGCAKNGFSFGRNPDHVLFTYRPGFLLWRSTG